jgi:hypothetical protein
VYGNFFSFMRRALRWQQVGTLTATKDDALFTI